LETLDPTKHIDYLLTSSVFLQKNDLNGWLQTFKPSFLQTQPSSPLKRKRGAENYPTFNSTFKETTCEECKGETIEDVTEGHVVCIKCGLIQHDRVYLPDSKVPFSLKLYLRFPSTFLFVRIVLIVHSFV
jgi:hypothetical protein